MRSCGSSRVDVQWAAGHNRSGAPVPCMDGRYTSRVTAAGGQQRGTQR